MAGNVVICAGRVANHLENVAPGGVTGSDEDSVYPWSNLERRKARDSWRPGRHASPAAEGAYANIDKNIIENSGAEDGVLEPWIEDHEGDGASAAVVTTPTPPLGTKAFRLTAGGDGVMGAALYQRKEIRAGEPHTSEVWLHGGGGSLVARAQLYIEETGQYVASNGSLTSTPTDFATRTTASYDSAPASVTFTAPAYTQQKKDGIWHLRTRAYVDGSTGGDVYFDGFVVWPHTDLAAVIGHEIMPVAGDFELHCSTDNFDSNDTTLSAFATVYARTMYALLGSMRSERYFRFWPQGTNSAPPWYGQLWLGQKLVLVEKPQYGLTWRWVDDQKRQKTTGGAPKLFRKQQFPTRQWDIPWEWITEDTFKQVRDRLFEATSYGNESCLLIADQDDPESAAMVLVPDILQAANESAQLRRGQFTLDEMAFPTFAVRS